MLTRIIMPDGQPNRRLGLGLSDPQKGQKTEHSAPVVYVDGVQMAQHEAKILLKFPRKFSFLIISFSLV
jgi:hypothetical protein